MTSPDAFGIRILAAEGYLEPGMPLDAAAELEEIDPELRDASEFLVIRVQIYSRQSPGWQCKPWPEFWRCGSLSMSSGRSLGPTPPGGQIAWTQHGSSWST